MEPRPQAEVPLILFAGTDPVIGCSFLRQQPDRRVVPFDITNATVEFYKKSRIYDPDPSPLYTTANGSILITDGPGGTAEIQVSAAHIPRRGQFRYHVDCLAAGHRLVLAWGPLSVLDH